MKGIVRMLKFLFRTASSLCILTAVTAMASAQINLPTDPVLAGAGSTTTTLGTGSPNGGDPSGVLLQWSVPTFTGTGIRTSDINYSTGQGGGTVLQCKATTTTLSSSYEGITELNAINAGVAATVSFNVILRAGASGVVGGGTDNVGCNSISSISPPSPQISASGAAGGGTGLLDYNNSNSGVKSVPALEPGVSVFVTGSSANGAAYYNGGS
jgi:hypothetical protein